VKARGEVVIRRDVIVREHRLNERQAQAVGLLLEQPEIALEELERLCGGVNRRTLQRDLQGLVEKRIVKMTGAARAASYRLKNNKL
jgi:predicted HTH transcriptional regulator